MRGRTRAAAAAAVVGVAVLAGTAGTALGSHIEVAPSIVINTVGHDPDGKVHVQLFLSQTAAVPSYRVVSQTLEVDFLRFANRCAPKGSLVMRRSAFYGIPVLGVAPPAVSSKNLRGHFRWNRHGFHILGYVHVVLKRDATIATMHGTARVQTATRDSGTLRFQASS